MKLHSQIAAWQQNRALHLVGHEQSGWLGSRQTLPAAHERRLHDDFCKVFAQKAASNK